MECRLNAFIRRRRFSIAPRENLSTVLLHNPGADWMLVYDYINIYYECSRSYESNERFFEKNFYRDGIVLNESINVS